MTGSRNAPMPSGDRHETTRSDRASQRNGARHANDRRPDPQRGPGSPVPDGQRGLAGNGKAAVIRQGTSASSRRSTTPSRRPKRPSSRSGTAASRRPQEGRRVHPQDLRRPGRGAGPAELEETKIGRLDHKIAKLRETIPLVPGVEYLRTDNVAGDDGLTLTDYAPFGVIGAITPVTHSLPTLAGNAINMLAAGNTVVFNAHPSGGKIAAEGVRRFNKAIREAIGLDNLLTIIDPPTLESAAQLFDHQGVRLLVVTGGPAVARAALASKKRAIVAGPGNPPVVVDAHRLPGERGQVDRRRRRVRQQPALHRREAGLRRRPDLRLADGGDDPPRRLPAHGRPGRRPDAGRVPERQRRQAARQQGPDRQGPGRPGRARGRQGPRGHDLLSARPAPSTRSSSTSR